MCCSGNGYTLWYRYCCKPENIVENISSSCTVAAYNWNVKVCSYARGTSTIGKSIKYTIL